MKPKILITCALAVFFGTVGFADPNIAELQAKIDELQQTVNKQEHTIRVAKETIRSLKASRDLVEKENDRLEKIMREKVKSTIVETPESEHSFMVGGIYYIGSVTITQHLDNGDFFADVLGRPVLIKGIDVSPFADEQVVRLSRVMRITRTQTYKSSYDSNTIYVFEPVAWYEVSFIKKPSKKS